MIFDVKTQEEMIGRYNALAINATNLKRKKVRRINRIEDLPDSVDWRKEGLVTPVQDQGKCGSGWAFAAVAATEGLHAKLFKNLTGLSAQNLIDCSRVDNQGCRGGLVDRAFDYIIENDGIDTEQSYSYKARDGKCRFKRRNVGATIDSYADIEFGDVNTLQQAVAAVGPIAVGIDASAYTFHFYSHGVYSDSQCSAWALNHAVTAVGYGALDGSAYWLVKNSWGTDWGQEGYILMARNGDNFCGIASAASYPLIKE